MIYAFRLINDKVLFVRMTRNYKSTRTWKLRLSLSPEETSAPNPLVRLTAGTKKPRKITKARLKFRDDRIKVADFGDNIETTVGTHPVLPVCLNTANC
jgi:hypothetical protein